jgi:hypothetical protein
MPTESPCKNAVKDSDDWFVELETLEDLIALHKEVGDDLIVSEGSIWVYDSYME